MTMRIYASTDASAPTLQGVVGGALSGSDWADGSLLQLLRKCLVTGYGSQTAAGWTQSFSGTSKGVFRQGAGCQFYMRVLDDGSMTAAAREAQFYGGETASDVDTLVAQFPTSAQQATYLKFRKSNTANSTQRPWTLYADNKTFYLYAWSNFGDGLTDYLSSMMFGDFYSYHPSDLYNCMAIGRVTSATLDALTNENLELYSAGTGLFTAGNTGHYMPRGYTQFGSSVNALKIANVFSQASAAQAVLGANGTLAFPNNADSKFWISRVYVGDRTTAPTSGIRGFMRGLWNPQHNASTDIPRQYPYAGSGNLAGRTFMVLGLRGGQAGVYTMETSDTWD